jgi:hypothetical protein
MGNTTSIKATGVSALESIRKDAYESWLRISAELIEVERELFFEESLPREKLVELIKKRTNLRRHKKLLQSNIDMADNGLLMIHQQEIDKLYQKSEKVFEILNKPLTGFTVSDDEANLLLEELMNSS